MAKAILTARRLKEVVRYDPETGIFTWLPRLSSDSLSPSASETWNKRWAWKPAGCLRPNGYIGMCIDKQQYQAHRLVWLYIHGEMPAKQIDHINMNRSDNRIANLRDVSQSINQQNRYRRKKASDLPQGVCLFKKNLKHPYEAKICKDRKTIHLGYYETPELAHQAYLKARKILHEGYISRSS